MREMKKNPLPFDMSAFIYIDTFPWSGCVSYNDLQTNIVTVGQFQENTPINIYSIDSELMKKITMVSFAK